jgi:glycerol-3-phosphate acyltransferase PlsY
LPVLGAWILVVLATGFVGLATISASLAAAVFLGVTALPERSGLFVFACATALLLIYAHRGNIRRMLNGTESRFASPAARWLRRNRRRA